MSFKTILSTMGKPKLDVEFIEVWLFNAYNNFFRKHHNMNHIRYGLQLIEMLSYAFQNRTNVEIAWLFHDCAYTPGSKYSELESAEKARYFLSLLNFDPVTIREIQAIILYNKSHSPTNKDINLFHDIDFAILGTPEEKYNNYVENIRAEYACFSNEQFIEGRMEFLKDTIQKGVFLTDEFRKKFGKTAIRNCTRELGSYT